MTESAAYDHINQWPALRRRMVRFWQRRCPDGGIIAHVQNPAPRPPAPPEDWMTAPTETDFLDPERFCRRQLWTRSSWHHYGDLYPYAGVSWGPNMFAGFLGAEVVFGPKTVWHEPVIQSIDQADRLHFDPDGARWTQHLAVVDWFAANVLPHRPVALTDFGGPADWLSVCMGTEAMLMACIETPEAVRETATRIAGECCRAFDIVAEKLSCADGTTNWMPVWCERTMMTVQDDIAVTLSPAMYADLFGQAVGVMASHAPVCTLHWHDAAARHVELFTKMDSIDVIQFGHDPDQGDFKRYLRAMKAIQAAGKRLFISCVEAGDVAYFLDELDHDGLMMIINTADDEASERMVEFVMEWG